MKNSEITHGLGAVWWFNSLKIAHIWYYAYIEKAFPSKAPHRAAQVWLPTSDHRRSPQHRVLIRRQRSVFHTLMNVEPLTGREVRPLHCCPSFFCWRDKMCWKCRFRCAAVFGSCEDANFRITVTNMHSAVSFFLYHLSDDISLSVVRSHVHVQEACATHILYVAEHVRHIFCMSLVRMFLMAVTIYFNVSWHQKKQYVFCCVREHRNHRSVTNPCFGVLLQFWSLLKMYCREQRAYRNIIFPFAVHQIFKTEASSICASAIKSQCPMNQASWKMEADARHGKSSITSRFCKRTQPLACFSFAYRSSHHTCQRCNDCATVCWREQRACHYIIFSVQSVPVLQDRMVLNLCPSNQIRVSMSQSSCE